MIGDDENDNDKDDIDYCGGGNGGGRTRSELLAYEAETTDDSSCRDHHPSDRIMLALRTRQYFNADINGDRRHVLFIADHILFPTRDYEAGVLVVESTR